MIAHRPRCQGHSGRNFSSLDRRRGVYPITLEISVGVEKLSEGGVVRCALSAVVARFCCARVPLGGRGQDGSRSLAEEADQALDVLRSRRQKELLSHKLQSSQAQGAQTDLILQFREQSSRLLSMPLCHRPPGKKPSRIPYLEIRLGQLERFLERRLRRNYFTYLTRYC